MLGGMARREGSAMVRAERQVKVRTKEINMVAPV